MAEDHGMYGNAERVAHVFRRLGLGAHPELATKTPTTGDAIASALDLSTPRLSMPNLDVPITQEDAINPQKIIEPIAWWAQAAAQPIRLIEERMMWFWQDHFATSLRKVPIPYLMWDQHLVMRQHATANFGDLLKAVSTSPAMLGYLDGLHNARNNVNENFAREVMELHTIGTGNYTQKDVSEAARAFTGWVVNVPFASDIRREVRDDVEPWASLFVARRHDEGTKTMLGQTGDFSMDTALDILLDHPATVRRISAKLFEHLVGNTPDEQTIQRLASAFSDYEIMNLIEAIVADPAFTSDAAIRTKVRTPFERMITVLQAFGIPPRGLGRQLEALNSVGFIPFAPPNPSGYPAGTELLGPHAVIHGFDLTRLIDPRDIPDDPFAALGIFDRLEQTQQTVDQLRDPYDRLAVVINSPEMMLT